MIKREEIYSRILKINKQLQEELNMSWDEIEEFWRECIQTARDASKIHKDHQGADGSSTKIHQQRISGDSGSENK